jgi:hypothetical protein
MSAAGKYMNATHRWDIVPVCVNYTCLDIKKKEHINEQTGCNKNGQVNVAGKLLTFDDYWCSLSGNEIVCVATKEGGQWNSCKPNGSVTCFKINLNTGKETYYNSPGINIGKVISVESI